ncbi:hypothetical protein JY651_02585 [Pyxidicoccus parkwayensis]|uniref:Uncharacterized protein n=1 Tax=Pyxidicoccus parkwayensis TaxID=2813578 RepID=A0ABX7NY93_9BACT|nr:hypothetical protein [Pyxidicoccus parkwaysis]QSQ23891.1 hypothetical protein JY651_02585 [Pyxidicoccus parkwaysis]
MTLSSIGPQKPFPSVHATPGEATAPSLEDALGRLFAAYAAHFLRGAWPLPRFQVEPRGPSLAIRFRTGERNVEVVGRASAFLLLSGRFWARTRSELAVDVPALIPALTASPLGVSGTWDAWARFHAARETKQALHDLALAVAARAPEEAVLLWRRVHERDLDWAGGSAPGSPQLVPPAFREAFQARAPVISMLTGRRSFTPAGIAKAVAPFAGSRSAVEQLAVATCLARGVQYLLRSNRLGFHGVAWPALLHLLSERDGAAYEVALGVVQQLAAKLFEVSAYAEARALLDVLVANGVGLPETLLQRWECRLYLDDPGAESDWVRALACETPDAMGLVGFNPSWPGDVLERRSRGLSRVARSLTLRAEGKDPCAERKAPKKPVVPSDVERARLLARATQLMTERMGAATPGALRDEVRAHADETVSERTFKSEDYLARGNMREAFADLDGALADYRAARALRIAGGLPWQWDHHGTDVRRLARLVAEPDSSLAFSVPPCFEPSWLCDAKRTPVERARALTQWGAQPWSLFPVSPAAAVGTPLAFVLLREAVAHSKTLWKAAEHDPISLGDRVAFTERARGVLDAYADRRDAIRLASVLEGALFDVFRAGENAEGFPRESASRRRPLLDWLARLASLPVIDEAAVLQGFEGRLWERLREKFAEHRGRYDPLRDLCDAVRTTGLDADSIAVTVAAYEALLANDWSNLDRPKKEWAVHGQALANLDAARLAPALIAWTRLWQRVPGPLGLTKLEAKWLWPLHFAWTPATEGFLLEVAQGELDNRARLTPKQKELRKSSLRWFIGEKRLTRLSV